MNCPYCSAVETKVTDSRDTGKYAIRRRRECLSCSRRFTTYESIEMEPLVVIKKDGTRQRYDRTKIKAGMQKALEKRPVSGEQIEEALSCIEEKIRRSGLDEIPTSTIGEYVMDCLRDLDQVAYIRFASVYRSFTDITHFEKEVQSLTSQ